MWYVNKNQGEPYMETERRTVQFDNDLKIEAYHLEGIVQKFPNHFHEHYVLGFVESGRRIMKCRNFIGLTPRLYQGIFCEKR